MKKTIIALFLYSAIALGCSEKRNEQLETGNQILGYDQKRMLSDVILDLVDTMEYYYPLDLGALGLENDPTKKDEALNYARKHGRIDSSRLIIFTRDKFIGYRDEFNLTDSMHSEIKKIIKSHLQNTKNSLGNYEIGPALDSLSSSMKFSLTGIEKQGRYEFVKEDNIKNIKGKYKASKIIAFSKIYYNNQDNTALFYFEQSCLDGVRCRSGSIVYLKKKNNKWIVSKLEDLWMT